MALFYLIFCLLCTAVLATPPYTPFEVYGPPSGGILLPEFEDIHPLQISSTIPPQISIQYATPRVPTLQFIQPGINIPDVVPPFAPQQQNAFPIASQDNTPPQDLGGFPHFPQREQIPHNEFPQEDVPHNDFPQQEDTPHSVFPQEGVPHNVFPQEGVPHNVFPQEDVPHNVFPQEGVPQNVFPQEDVPHNDFPENVPHNEIPHNNNYIVQPHQDNHVPEQKNIVANPSGDVPETPDYLKNPQVENHDIVPNEQESFPHVPVQVLQPNIPEEIIPTQSNPDFPSEEVPSVPSQVVATPDNKPQVISIQDKNGQYSFGVNQPGPEGQVVKEQGRLISTNDGWEYVIAKKGSYSYTSPEGVPVTVEWEADHNGFRILSSSL